LDRPYDQLELNKVVLGSVILLGAYALIRDYTTVSIPTTEDERLQVGFGTADWGLTPAGREWKRLQPGITAEQLVRNEGYTQNRVGIIWTRASMNLAATLMLILYITTFVSWTAGFAGLGKGRSGNG
jgi:hypothetical protein